MADSLRALVVVFGCAFVVLYIVRPSATVFISSADFRRWAGAWLAVTVIGFLAPNFWLMLLLTGSVAIFAARREPVKPALFMLLFTALPMVGLNIPGFGIVNRIFEVNFQLMLVLLLLVPLVLAHVRRYGVPVTALEDKLLLGFFLLSWLLYLRAPDTTVTSFMREGFVMALGMLVPYFAFSRNITSPAELKRGMLAFLLPMLIYAPIGVFEMVKFWSLYLHPPDVWGLGFGKGSAARAGLMRANGPVGHGSPIVFGSLFVVACGFLLALGPERIRGRRLWLGTVSVWSGLLSTLSRGPWVGGAVVYIVYWLTTPGKVPKAITYGLPVLLLGLVLLATPFGATIWALLPFIGTTEAEGTVDYRQQVWNVSWHVIMKSPLLGHPNPTGLPEMQVLMTGAGIIDVVNTYLVVVLNKGLMGLFLFCGFFAVVLLRLRKAWRRQERRRAGDAHIGRALFATMAGLLVIIVTVSPVGHMPMLYWSLAGMCVAYTRCALHAPARTVAHRNPLHSPGS